MNENDITSELNRKVFEYDKSELNDNKLLYDNLVVKDLTPKFSHNSTVIISKGFYKGYTGIVKSYNVKNNVIYYQVEINELDADKSMFREDELKFKSKFLGLF